MFYKNQVAAVVCKCNIVKSKLTGVFSLKMLFCLYKPLKETYFNQCKFYSKFYSVKCCIAILNTALK